MRAGVPVFCSYCVVYNCIEFPYLQRPHGLQLMPPLTPGLWISSFALLAYTGLCVSLPSSPLRSPQTRSPRLRTCLG